MEQVSGIAFVAKDVCTPTQLEDLHDGIGATSAFRRSAQQHPSFRDPYVEGLWYARMVFRIGDILIDPAFVQTQRNRNDFPRLAGFLTGTSDGRTTRITATENQPSTAAYWRSIEHGSSQTRDRSRRQRAPPRQRTRQLSRRA